MPSSWTPPVLVGMDVGKTGVGEREEGVGESEGEKEEEEVEHVSTTRSSSSSSSIMTLSSSVDLDGNCVFIGGSLGINLSGVNFFPVVLLS